MKYTEEDIAKIKKDRADARSLSYDEIVFRLENVRNGANVHTVNKCIFYLNYFHNNEDARFKNGRHFDRLDELRYRVYGYPIR